MIAHAVYEYDSRIMGYAKALADEGHHVDVIALTDGNRKAPARRQGRVHVIPVQAVGKKKAGRIYYLSCVMGFLVRAGWLAMRRDCKKHYDLVHVHSVPDFLVFAALFPRLRGAKVILDIHDILPEFYLSKFGQTSRSVVYRLLLGLERLSARFAHHVIAANDIWRAKLVSRSVPAGKCSVMLNFPDRAIFQRRGENKNGHRVVIMYPGTLNQHQGIDIAIRAFSRIKHQLPSAEFHIYGTGPQEDSLKRLAAELNVADRVKFNGFQPLSAIAALMADADLGVVPKRNDAFGSEAFSTKILEFMAMGVPVVVADTKVDRYYFDNSLVKFFAAGDEASLAEAMLAVLQNRDLRERLLGNASRFAAIHDWERHKHDYISMVERLVQGKALLKGLRTRSGIGTGERPSLFDIQKPYPVESGCCTLNSH